MSIVGDENRPSRSDLCADVVIVGGGLAGIACAIGLRDSGLKIVLLEETGSLGGRARSWVDLKSGDVIDLGPRVLPGESPNMRSMLQELGTHEHVAWDAGQLATSPDEGGETRASTLTPPLHLLPALAHAQLSFRDKLSNAPLLWLALRIDESDIDELDDTSAAELLRRHGVTQRCVDLFWARIAMSRLNTPLESCSAGALMRVCAQLVGHRDEGFGLADCGLGDLYIPGAMRSIMGAGGRVHLRSRVVALICNRGRAGGVVLDDGTRICATHSVLAVPPQALNRLLSARCRSQRPFSEARAFEPCPHITTYLWLDRKLSGRSFWTCNAAARDQPSDFYDLSNIRAGWRERPSVIASNIVCGPDAERMSDEEIVVATKLELAQTAPAAAQAMVLHSVVNRIPMAIPRPAPGTEQRRPQARTSIEGLLLAGDWTRTDLPASMESAVRSGRLAAEQIWSAMGSPRQLALTPHPPEGLAGFVHRVASGTRHRHGSTLRVPQPDRLAS